MNGSTPLTTKAYLDIETAWSAGISVIGVYRPGLGTEQLVAPKIRREALAGFLDGVTHLYTFNGASFDLPVIKNQLDIDLKQRHAHIDLLRACRRFGLKGGLKKVEQLLGIWRDTEGVDGMQAMRLWERHRLAGDQEALDLLLRYNREDCENLEALEARLSSKFGKIEHAQDTPPGQPVRRKRQPGRVRLVGILS